MKRILYLEQRIIGGYIVRDILKIFPGIEDSFIQRKTYDEYYFKDATIELDIDKIASLNKLGFRVSITCEEVELS